LRWRSSSEPAPDSVLEPPERALKPSEDASARAAATRFSTFKPRAKDLTADRDDDALTHCKEIRMNRPVRSTVRSIFIAGLVAAAAITASAPSAAKSKCDQPQGHAEQRACAEAARSFEALRSFVLRTRMIYGLYLLDFVPEEQRAAAAPATATITSQAAR
jgi:hypothetical protein